MPAHRHLFGLLPRDLFWLPYCLWPNLCDYFSDMTRGGLLLAAVLRTTSLGRAMEPTVTSQRWSLERNNGRHFTRGPASTSQCSPISLSILPSIRLH
jgi:hypothetical protein